MGLALLRADFILVYGIQPRHWMPAYAGIQEPYIPLQAALDANIRQQHTYGIDALDELRMRCFQFFYRSSEALRC
jgi:hypothetical protein